MKTGVYNVRLDLRAIATLHKHYSAQGIEISSISTLTRQAIESLANLLIKQSDAYPFESTTEAISYLESLGLMKPLRTRGNRALIKTMQEENLILEGLDTGYLNKKGLSKVSPDQYEAARKILDDKRNDSEGAILGINPGEVKGR